MKHFYDLNRAASRPTSSRVSSVVAVLLTLLLLSACGVVQVKKPPEPAPKGPLKSARFEGGNAGDTPAGWDVSSYTPGDGPDRDETAKYKIELTKSQKHGGKMSAALGPVGKDKLPTNLFGEARFCGDAPFSGAAVKASAFIKGDPKSTVRFMVTQRGRPFTGIQKSVPSWTKIELLSLAPIPDPGPPDTRTRHLMCIHLGVSGSNRAWIDDLTFEKADVAFPPEKVRPIAIENLDMERFDRGGTLANWTHLPGLFTESQEPSPGYELRADRKTKRSGAASLLLTTDEAPPEPPGDSASYCIDPTEFRGKNMRLAGWLKADVAEEQGRDGSSIGIFAAPFAIEDIIGLTEQEREEFTLPGETSSADMSLYQAADWVRYELIVLIPKATISLCISIRLDHVGSVWADDLSVEVIL